MTPALRRWHEHLVLEGALTTSARGAFTWVVISAFVVALLGVCAFVEPVANRVQLAFAPALCSYLALPALAIVDGLARRARWSRATAMLSVLGNFLVELYPALLIAFCGASAASLFAAFYLLTALFHAQLFRISLKYPFWLACFALQGVISLVINHDGDHVEVWVLLALATLSAALIIGTARLREDGSKAESSRLRTALAAQLLEVEANRGSELEQRMSELLGIAHDFKSPLTAASLDLSELERQLSSLGRPELVASAEAVRASLSWLKELLQATRTRALTMQVELKKVSLRPVAERVAERVRRAFPAVEFRVDVTLTAKLLAAVGEESVERILENLFVNACEGDGGRGATFVKLSATPEAGAVVIVLEDDGPGFPAEFLEKGITSYATTKMTGTGLGLFTAARLVGASGGSLVRENREAGGARITLRMRTA